MLQVSSQENEKKKKKKKLKNDSQHIRVMGEGLCLFGAISGSKEGQKTAKPQD